MTEENILKVPRFFPRAPSACRPSADPFFKCLNEHSKKTSDDDVDASKRGLAACTKEMKAYEECMIKYEVKKPEQRMRVQEEYRMKSST
mmetsp:Transcript_24511/g.36056  ORF Transcript_24511/g.36056 Transcript_24511/m.36056 type:complete len:89 (-) Transcript_24511:69-335(-)